MGLLELSNTLSGTETQMNIAFLKSVGFTLYLCFPTFCSQENACARCMLKACICCLWCLEKCLTYLNQVRFSIFKFYVRADNVCDSQSAV